MKYTALVICREYGAIGVFTKRYFDFELQDEPDDNGIPGQGLRHAAIDAAHNKGFETYCVESVSRSMQSLGDKLE